MTVKTPAELKTLYESMNRRIDWPIALAGQHILFAIP